MTCPVTYVLGMKVSATSYDHASDAICEWAHQGHSKYVCVSSVNNVMEAFDSTSFMRVMNEADLVTPDGMPIVWSLKLLGNKKVTRVYGPDLTPVLLEKAARQGLNVGFYGGKPEVLTKLVKVLRHRFPNLKVTYAFSPPFRALTEEEDAEIVQHINRSGVNILFIGLNTPKQDYWMAAHKIRVQAVMVGVGAAFDFLAGTKLQAPRWMRRIGLEWFFRLATEPRRLWKRYLKHNPRFLLFVALQLLGRRQYVPNPPIPER